MLTADVRLKDMPNEWFVTPAEEALKNSICASIGVLVCNRAMDQMNFDLAKQTAQELLDKTTELVPIHKNVLATEIIFCELIGENNKDTLEERYTLEFRKYMKLMKSYPSVIRLQYAYELLANHDEKAANDLLNKFEKVKKSYPNACEIEGELELIEYSQKIYLSKVI